MKENINKIELLIKNKKFDEVLDYLNNSNKKDFKENFIFCQFPRLTPP